MFLPFRPNVDFGPSTNKQNIIMALVILAIWTFAFYAVYHTPTKEDPEPQQNTPSERTYDE